jgi:hypothetical protein
LPHSETSGEHGTVTTEGGRGVGAPLTVLANQQC